MVINQAFYYSLNLPSAILLSWVRLPTQKPLGTMNNNYDSTYTLPVQLLMQCLVRCSILIEQSMST